MGKHIRLPYQIIKATGLLLFLVCISANHRAYSQKLLVDLAAQHVSMPQDETDSSKKLKKVIYLDGGEKMLGEVLENIAEQANLKLSYSEELIPMSMEIFVDPGRATVEQAMWSVLEGTSLRFGISSAGQLFFFEREKEKTSSKQLEQTITGTIIDSQTKEALPGVNVVAKDAGEAGGAPIGTTTDIDGQYELDVPDDVTTLIFSYVGYKRLEVPIDGRTEINIELSQDVQMLEDVVVIGYGSQSRVSVTGSISRIDGEELVERPVNSIQQALQGKLSGLTILDKGGSPTSPNQHIVIRGVNTLYSPAGLSGGQTSSIGANEPLVLVDGVEQPYQNINPDNVESISVLKDASSTAIYGSRGANGVILITTKSASEGDISVSYNSYFGLQKATTKPKHMELEPYMRLQNVAHENIGAAPEFTEEEIQAYINGDRLEYPLPYDWYNVMFDIAPQTSHSLTLSGGNEAFKTRMNLRYKNQDGIITNVNSKTIEASLNTIFNVSPSISVTTDINYRRSDNVEPHNMTEIFRLLMQNAIWTVPKYPGGTYGGGEQGNNPLLLAETGGLNTIDSHYVLGNIKGDWRITEDLLFSTRLAIDTDMFLRKDYQSTWQTIDGSTVKRRNQTNRLTEFRNNSNNLTFYNTLNYFFDLSNSHSFDLLAGYSYIKQVNADLNAYRQDFYNNEIRSLNQGANDASLSNFGRDTEWGLLSGFGRFKYSYQDKYLLEITSRYDGSSRFTRDNRYKFFPSFSIGWRLSQEKFWEKWELDSYVNEFKIRGSWGKTGKQTVALYSYLPTMNIVQYSFNGAPVEGILQQERANEDLTWETTTQLNGGLDVEFLSNRLSLTIDYYVKTTDDILLSLPVPGTLGLNGGPQNAGKVENKGWEFAAKIQDNSGAFNYSANLNFNINKNKVISLAETGPFIYGSDIDPRYITGEGYPINSFWGYKTDGLFQSDEEAQNYPEFQRPAKAGDVKILDLNNDGVINPDDMTYLGNSYPTYTFGANFNFNYKGFGLNVLFQGAADVYMRYARALAEAGNYEGFTPDIYTGNYWTPDNTDARFARPTKRNVRNQASTDRMLIDASYIRLKNLQLSYQIPSRVSRSISADQIRVYVSGTNLLTFSDLNEWNLDPEATSGWQNFYPPTSEYTLGLSIQF